MDVYNKDVRVAVDFASFLVTLACVTRKANQKVSLPHNKSKKSITV